MYFYTKNEVFAQNFHPIVQIGDKPIVQIGDKTWTMVPQNVHLVIKNRKICTFYTKNEVFAQQFDPIVQIGIKTGVWYPKMYIWSLKRETFFFYEWEHRTGKMCPFSSLHPLKKGREV